MDSKRYRFTFIAWKHPLRALTPNSKPADGEAWSIMSYPGAVVATARSIEAAELKLRATLECYFKFAGSIGAEVAGRCVGRGDNFDIVVSGVPRYDSGDVVPSRSRR